MRLHSTTIFSTLQGMERAVDVRCADRSINRQMKTYSMSSLRKMLKQLIANQKASADVRRFLLDQEKISYFYYSSSLHANNPDGAELWHSTDDLVNEHGEHKIQNLTVNVGGRKRGTRLLYIEGIIFQAESLTFKIRHFGVPLCLPSKRDIAAMSLATFALALQQQHGVQAIEFKQANLVRAGRNWRQEYIDFFAHLGAIQLNAGNDSEMLHYIWNIPNAAPVLARPLPSWWRLRIGDLPH